jgi:hypothetical protein
VGQVLALEVIVVFGTAHLGRTLTVFRGNVELLIHFLAKTAAIPYLGGDGTELFCEVDFKEVEHGVEGDE